VSPWACRWERRSTPKQRNLSPEVPRNGGLVFIHVSHDPPPPTSASTFFYRNTPTFFYSNETYIPEKSKQTALSMAPPLDQGSPSFPTKIETNCMFYYLSLYVSYAHSFGIPSTRTDAWVLAFTIVNHAWSGVDAHVPSDIRLRQNWISRIQCGTRPFLHVLIIIKNTISATCKNRLLYYFGFV